MPRGANGIGSVTIMKKIISAIVLTTAIIMPHCAQASAAESLYLNNVKLDSLISDNGEAKIEIRSFFESAGYTVLWDTENNRSIIYNSEKIITMYEGKNLIFLDGAGSYLDDDIKYVDGNLVMPVDAAMKALNASVEYKSSDIYITSSEVCDSSVWQYQILELTNAEREKNGLDKLVWNSDLAQAASKHAEDMASRGYFSHTTPEELSPFDRLKNLGISYTYAAENIAAGQSDPQAAFNAWVQSEHHYENILNPNLKEMGAAFSRGGEYGIYWAQEFATTV